MSRFEFPTRPTLSPDTEELAAELQREHPDPHLVKWLIDDRDADVRAALAQAHLDEKDLHRKAHLRLLCLQQYLHN